MGWRYRGEDRGRGTSNETVLQRVHSIIKTDQNEPIVHVPNGSTGFWNAPRNFFFLSFHQRYQAKKNPAYRLYVPTLVLSSREIRGTIPHPVRTFISSFPSSRPHPSPTMSTGISYTNNQTSVSGSQYEADTSNIPPIAITSTSSKSRFEIISARDGGTEERECGPWIRV